LAEGVAATAKEEVVTQLFRVGGSAQVETEKNGSALVEATIEGVEGELHVQNVETWQGLQGAVRVPVAAFNSGLELRDKRIQEVFLGGERWPNAVWEFSAPDGFGDALNVGETRTLVLPGQLSVGGGKADLALELSFTREGSRRYAVTTVKPASISIAGLGLSEPLGRLIELCAHESVRDEVKLGVLATVTD